VSNDAQIIIEGVDVVYESGPQRLRALADINLTVGRGEFVSIIGPSGCGKSTLLRIAGGLQSPTSGRVLIDGRSPRELQRDKQLGFVFQDPSLMPWRNVIENVRLPLQVNRVERPSRDAKGMVDLVGLREFQHYYPHQLSGGMQQRVAIARSFVTSPSVLLMDEPFGALDEITRTAMRYELMRVWRSEAGAACTVLFVTHSIAEAVLMSDRVVVFTPQPGRIATIMDIDLPRPRTEDVEADPAFIRYTQALRGLLKEHALV
jgi:NitT/TauT family transport system ATP-binding protein